MVISFTLFHLFQLILRDVDNKHRSECIERVWFNTSMIMITVVIDVVTKPLMITPQDMIL